VEDLKIVDPKLQWEKIYQTKQLTEVSWYRPRLEVSLQLNEEAAPNLDASIIDVGAGESTLVDDLLARGYRNVYAMDISSTPS
jgi:2-polyprenyl-3-methyl-5-hydroxy-6-metoxy-1,4-benzoquinol methylase